MDVFGNDKVCCVLCLVGVVVGFDVRLWFVLNFVGNDELKCGVFLRCVVGMCVVLLLRKVFEGV